jgi:hypothetical protein
MKTKQRMLLRQMKANPLNIPRTEHINMIVNVVRYKRKILRTKLPTEEDDKPVELDQNYNITKWTITKLKIGKDKGEEYEKEVVINPPKKRYKLLSQR